MRSLAARGLVTCATSDEIYNYDNPGRLRIPNTHDVGLVILDQPIVLPEYGERAPVGTRDSLMQPSSVAVLDLSGRWRPVSACD